MNGTQQYLTNLKNEIKSDPAGLGYAGKTPQQIADLINTPYTVSVPIIQGTPPAVVLPGGTIGTNVVVESPRVFNVIGGIPGAPNGVTAQDVINSGTA